MQALNDGKNERQERENQVLLLYPSVVITSLLVALPFYFRVLRQGFLRRGGKGAAASCKAIIIFKEA